MGRKRTLGVGTSSTDDAASASSPRRTIGSPRSPSSQGTFDSYDMNSTVAGNASTVAGGWSVVESVIGHDDPTLVHANIAPCTSNSGVVTINSFLTEYNSNDAGSEDIRNSSHTSGSGIVSVDARDTYSTGRVLTETEILERQLSELDRTQEAWKARHQQDGTSRSEIDATADIYMNEVGSFKQTSPRKKPSSLQEQTIIEEEESCAESSRDQSDDESFQVEKNKVEALGKLQDDANEEDIEDDVVVAANVAVESSDSIATSVNSDLVFEYPSTEDSEGQAAQTARSIHTRNSQNVTVIQGSALGAVAIVDNAGDETAEEVGETDLVVRQVQQRLYDSSFNHTSIETQLADQSIKSDALAERTLPRSDQRKPGFRSWIPVGDGSERSRSRSQRPRGGLANMTVISEESVNTDDDFYRKRNRKLCILNLCIILMVLAAIVCSVLFAIELIGAGNKDTAAQQRSSTPPPQATVPSGRPLNTPSPVAINSDANPSITSPPVESPTDDSTTGRNNPTASPVDNSDLTTDGSNPTASPLEISDSTTDRNSPTASPVDNSESDLPTSPTVATGTTEERLLQISGDAIKDESTPQYAAYNWLQNQDPANLDLDSLSDQDLSQRYIAALFYFSLDGDNWIDKYRFLDESNVCEWNNGSTRNRLGIRCSDGTIDGFSVNKYGTVTGIAMSK